MSKNSSIFSAGALQLISSLAYNADSPVFHQLLAAGIGGTVVAFVGTLRATRRGHSSQK